MFTPLAFGDLNGSLSAFSWADYKKILIPDGPQSTLDDQTRVHTKTAGYLKSLNSVLNSTEAPTLEAYLIW